MLPPPPSARHNSSLPIKLRIKIGILCVVLDYRARLQPVAEPRETVKSKPLLAKPAVLLRSPRDSRFELSLEGRHEPHKGENLGKKKQRFILQLLKGDCCWEHLNYASHSQKLKTGSYLQAR